MFWGMGLANTGLIVSSGLIFLLTYFISHS
jgi:hypothetical protein